MQPCSREMQAMNSFLCQTQQIPLENLESNGHQQIQNPKFEPTSSTTSYDDDFLEQMLSSTSTLPSGSWSDLKSPWDLPKPDDQTGGGSNPDHNNVGFNYDEVLASKLRQHQINGGGGPTSPPTTAMKMMMQQQMMLTGRAAAASAAAAGGGGGGGGGWLSIPLSLSSGNDIVDGSLFKSPNHQGGDGAVQALYNGFGGGSLHGTNQPQHFHHSQASGFGANARTAMNQTQAGGSNTGGTPAQPKQRVRARRGQATDPHSIAERLRRERIAERMKALQELVPNGNKTDKASMLDEIIDYVKFLQLQVKVLSMSRLGGAAAAVAPLVADAPSEGGRGDCIQTSGNGGPHGRNSNGNDSLTVTEDQVAKLMEEDMGSAMQYLQGKGLCLMPISLATAISTVTCQSKNNPMINNVNPNNNRPLRQASGGEGPSSPSMSVLTVQSAAAMGNGGVDGSIKDAASVSKP
ncbi:hypothetical protein PTKIN_Ptkin19aG0115000 [Pterospermum kingtungense]